MSENEQLNGSTGSGQNENQLRQKFQEVWQNKNYRIIICVVAALIVLYIGHGFYITSHYEGKCKDAIAVLSDMNKLSDKFNAANGDPNDSDTKDAIEELNYAAKEIASINESLKSLTPPDGKQGERTQITSYLDKYEIMFKEAHDIMTVKGLIIKKINPDTINTLEKEIVEYRKAYEAINNMMPLLINGENVKNVFDLDKFSKAWMACFDKREARDKSFYEEKKKEYKTRLEESNNQLKAKKEVVFLPQVLFKEGKNIEIKGDFYNGTDKSISDIEEVTVDVVFKRLDDTVYTIENYKVPKNDIGGYATLVILRPNDQTGLGVYPELILKGEGEKIKEAFDNYVITVKNIKYSLYTK